MMKLIDIRYSKGAGDNSIYVRLRDANDQFRDFVAAEWVAVESANCGSFFIEHADSDPHESLFLTEIDIPSGGQWILEAVRNDTKAVISNETVEITTTGGIPVDVGTAALAVTAPAAVTAAFFGEAIIPIEQQPVAISAVHLKYDLQPVAVLTANYIYQHTPDVPVGIMTANIGSIAQPVDIVFAGFPTS